MHQPENFIFFLLAAVALDILFRLIAYGRIDSIAIDIAIFSAIYSGLHLQTVAGGTGDQIGSEILRFFFGLIVVLVLAGLHGHLRDRTRAQVRNVFNDLRSNLTNNPTAINLLDAQQPIIEEVTDLTFWPANPKKRDRRRKVRDELCTSGLDPQGLVTEDTFLLPPTFRWLFLAVFFLLAVVSIMIPLWDRF